MSKKFYECPMLIQAEQTNETTTIMTPSGELTLKSSEYICTTPDGVVFAIREDAFKTIFQEM